MKRFHILILAVAAMVAAAACGPKKAAPVIPDTAYAEYVKAYTGGTVSSRSVIRVDLVEAVPEEARSAEGLFQFSPSLKGTVRWADDHTVEFLPDEGALTNGTAYNCTFRLGKVAEVKDKELKDFRFGFSVAKRQAGITVDEITIPSGKTEALVKGTLTFSEPVAREDAVRMFRCEYPYGSTVVNLSDGTESFRFEVAGVSRSEMDRTIRFRLEGDDFECTPVEAVIPAQTDFRILSARYVDEDNPCIEVQFSEALSPKAAEKGHITLDGVVRYHVSVSDNIARAWFEGKKADEITVTVHRTIQSAEGVRLGTDWSSRFAGSEIKPAVILPVQGNILPDKARLILPFRSANLRAVDLRVIRIYESNILMFLQDNDLDESSSIRRAGRLVCSKRIDLAGNPSKDLHKWQDFSIDLSGLFRKEPGAIYRIRLSFKPEYSLYNKDASSLSPMTEISDGTPTPEEMAVWDTPETYYWDNSFDWDLYDWDDRDDPDTPSYYMESDRFPQVNLLTSDIGLVAKYAGGDRIWLTATDLISAKPLAGATLDVYNFQLQKIASGKSDGEGMAELAVDGRPFAVVARSGNSTSYLKVTDANEKSLSRFDVGGKRLTGGLKGFIYGERGVWRPGDTLHVTLLVSDRDKPLPAGHPATLELYTPEGQFHSRKTAVGQDGFFTFHIPTAAQDPTGFWNAYVKVGGVSFHKSLHLETIKPNRLKINTEFGVKTLEAGTKLPVSVNAAWLTGAPASGLKAHAAMTLSSRMTTFQGFDGYIFRNPASTFARSETELYRTKLDENGEATVEVSLPDAENAPGMLTAFVVSTVEENGGDESFTTATLPYSPFQAYVGVKFPEGDYLETDRDNKVQIAVVNAAGKRVGGHPLEYRVFKLDWRWWWESRREELDSYVNGSDAEPVLSGTLTSSASKDVSFTIRVDYPTWGRYLVFVRDMESGHVSGDIVTIDWPATRGRADRRDPEALTMLTFSSDKEAYEAGEVATVYIPAAAGGRALVSLENGSRVLSRQWVSTSAGGDTAVRIPITKEMAPNFYVHITLIQPYGSAANDLPLRLYGVKRIAVTNPASHLEPVIKMEASIHPEEPFTVQVSEKSGREMTYTLAIVDEGLLDLTGFKTPQPWSAMYETEALGVRTWDLFDEVIGAFSGRFSPVASIGGDQENIVAAKKDNRFNPVVKFLGPFTLKKGSFTHKITLPMYVGSVRVMVVAGHDGAYGATDKTVAVKAPLMVLSTLPRTVSEGEAFTLPVNVFAMEDDVRDVTVRIAAEGPVRIEGPASNSLSFSKAGDKVARFHIVTTGEGTAKFTVNASGNGHKAHETVALSVGNPNPVIRLTAREKVDPGKQASFEAGTGGTLELAVFPALDAAAVASYMGDYPYECSEQLSARGLALLHLLPQLGDADAAKAKERIPAIISKLYARQNGDGGFLYWPGARAADPWVSSMAGAFLSEASGKGFPIEKGVLRAWTKYQKEQCRIFRRKADDAFGELDEAYRLYTLAVAGSPEAGSMNRLKETAGLGYRAKWVLASAYAVTGKAQIAKQLIGTITDSFEEYAAGYATYGSSLRDKALALEALALTDDIGGALPLALEISEKVNAGSYSTQEAGFAAVAMDRLHGKFPAEHVAADVTAAGKKQDVSSAKAVLSLPVQGDVNVRNTGAGPLYATLLTTERRPAGTPVPARADGLSLRVAYSLTDGTPVNPASIRQGTEFTASVTVAGTSAARDYRNLALRMKVPSGWEILNQRLLGILDGEMYDYQDIRDDRCDWFFDLPHGTAKTFQIRLRAAYEGSYVLPAVTCEAMYDPHVAANTASGKAEVVR